MLVRLTFQPDRDLTFGTSKGKSVTFRKDNPVADIPEEDFAQHVADGLKMERVAQKSDVALEADDVKADKGRK